jgi:hypothetical protein
VQGQQPAQEVDHHPQVLPAMGERLRALLELVEALLDVGDVLARRAPAGTGRRR